MENPIKMDGEKIMEKPLLYFLMDDLEGNPPIFGPQSTSRPPIDYPGIAPGVANVAT